MRDAWHVPPIDLAMFFSGLDDGFGARRAICARACEWLWQPKFARRKGICPTPKKLTWVKKRKNRVCPRLG